MKTNLLIPTLVLTCAVLAPHLPAAEQVLSLSNGQTPPPAESPAPTPAEPQLRFNFRGAPLETVLNYMSQAAGYIVVLQTPLRGTVDMWSDQPVSRAEALQLLNLALDKNGYAVSVQGRNLIVTSKDDAKKRNIPIHTGNNPEDIPPTAEMVMQIIPLQHIDATQASQDLASLLPASATLTANKDSNSLIVTDTQMNVRHIVEIVAALDTSSDTVTALRVFRLKNADPVEMAQLLTSLFQSTTPSTGAGNTAFGGGFAAFLRNRGGGGGGGGNRGGGFGGNASTTSSARTTPVVAIADPRTFSIVVTAAREQMPEISAMIEKLDSSPARKQKVFVYTMENADVQQVEAVLKNLFQTTNARSSTSTEADALTSRATANSQASSTTNNTLSLGGSSGTSR
ncbi:MAG TPA: secretin N-terminal domain-containing protein [Lacunisphaera sp.]|jgi:general secretion pathway protein D